MFNIHRRKQIFVLKSVLEHAEIKYRIKKVCVYICVYVCRPFLVNTITSVRLRIFYFKFGTYVKLTLTYLHKGSIGIEKKSPSEIFSGISCFRHVDSEK